MTNDIDKHETDTLPVRREEQPIDLEHVTIENPDAPDECAIFPRGADDDELMTTWITAHDDSFVDLASMR
ncbi:DUF7511 domain-containing protein [Halosolutus gelatinilyticus]|uniref:DUF7511 domain-containing protein n=1 Tax=Halosolutus gelatinilyticus TaxID=2931975 RepID=UPI001FF2756A|nr:hypothetical protein [Halosolutus gelatinilyticus]